MPSTVRLGVLGVRELDEALSGLSDGMDRELAAALQQTAQAVVPEARRLTPRGPGPQSARDNLPHVAETIFATAAGRFAQIVSPHPAAGWLEYGGTVHPNRHRITIAGHAMAHRAAESQLDRLESELEERLVGLYVRHGLA